MTHVPEQELALYAAHPDGLPPARRAAIEAHLAVCADCQESQDFFRIREDDLGELGEHELWEPVLGSATYDSLMAHGARVAEEDREAEVLLKDFLESPVTAAWTTLAARRRYRTGGVVRKLNAAAHAAYENDPLDALTFADAAISVVETLPDDLYPAKAVYRLRGTAWKERANALMFLGQFPQAHDALDRAERAYRKTPNNGLGLSIAALVRAGVLYEQGRLDEAMAQAERAEHGFAHAADEKRRMDAVFLRGGILFEAGQARAAIALFQQVIDYGEAADQPFAIARACCAKANCEVDLALLAEASMNFQTAMTIFRSLGADTYRVVAEWGMARVFLHSGRTVEAIRRLREVVAELERRGMVTFAGLAGLDITEALLSLGRSRDIVELAQHLFGVFRDAGMLTGALSALAYLKEAAASGELRPYAIKELRSFLKRAQHQPDLQFVPPQSPPA